MLNFDDIQEWGTALTAALRGLVPDDAGAIIAARRPEFMEDAMDIVLDDLSTDRRAVIDAVGAWIEGQPVAAFHGSRLTEDETKRVRAEGLKMLRASDRTERLRAVLATHPLWAAKAGRLEAAVQAYGVGNRGGHREGQVHATLSRNGVLSGFNHYLTHGSEFDQHVAHELLGQEGKELLGTYGQPVLFRLSVPGSAAVSAANPRGLFSEPMGSLVREFLRAWSYWLPNPHFSPASQKIDCGLVFYADVPSEWLVEAEWVSLPGSESA